MAALRKTIYLDHASTTPLDPQVWAAMEPYYTLHYGNPSSPHGLGARAKVALEGARRTLGTLLQAQDGHIFFTSGGTEANNWALAGAIQQYGLRHVITSPIEHKSVLAPLTYWEKVGKLQVHYLPIDQGGEIDYAHLETLLKRCSKVLVSLMHGNNELGTLQDIQRIGKLAQQYGALFHCDMVQTLAYEPIALSALPVDLAVGSAHKFHGPKGVGFLYVDPRIKIPPLLRGGMQEQGGRGGTENVAAVVGLAEAFRRAHKERTQRVAHIQSLKRYMYAELQRLIPASVAHGYPLDPNKGLCHILNVGFPKRYKQELLLLQLDMMGIATSSGSACMSGTAQRSHVLDALGVPPDQACLRFSLSHHSKQEELALVVKKIASL